MSRLYQPLVRYAESADAGASLTYPQQAGTIRKNAFIVSWSCLSSSRLSRGCVSVNDALVGALSGLHARVCGSEHDRFMWFHLQVIKNRPCSERARCRPTACRFLSLAFLIGSLPVARQWITASGPPKLAVVLSSCSSSPILTWAVY